MPSQGTDEDEDLLYKDGEDDQAPLRHSLHSLQISSHSLQMSNSHHNEEQGAADISMDSFLPSAVNPKYQVYPLPPSGIQSLIGGFVALDGQSVELPPNDAQPFEAHVDFINHSQVQESTASFCVADEHKLFLNWNRKRALRNNSPILPAW